MTPDPDHTQLLVLARGGDRRATDEILRFVYDELREIARLRMSRERRGHSLQPTALVHEAYLRLIDQSRAQWEDHAHFKALASSMIRRVLIDRARRRGAAKRGRGPAVTLDPESVRSLGRTGSEIDLVALSEALDELARLDERQARGIELRFFGGLSVDECARVLGISPRSVDADWQMARAWLRVRLESA